MAKSMFPIFIIIYSKIEHDIYDRYVHMYVVDTYIYIHIYDRCTYLSDLACYIPWGLKESDRTE